MSGDVLQSRFSNNERVRDDTPGAPSGLIFDAKIHGVRRRVYAALVTGALTFACGGGKEFTVGPDASVEHLDGGDAGQRPERDAGFAGMAGAGGEAGDNSGGSGGIEERDAGFGCSDDCLGFCVTVETLEAPSMRYEAAVCDYGGAKLYVDGTYDTLDQDEGEIESRTLCVDFGHVLALHFTGSPFSFTITAEPAFIENADIQGGQIEGNPFRPRTQACLPDPYPELKCDRSYDDGKGTASCFLPHIEEGYTPVGRVVLRN